jgi:hypothetical protein
MRKFGRRVQHLVGADELAYFAIDHRVQRLLCISVDAKGNRNQQRDQELVFHRFRAAN